MAWCAVMWEYLPMLSISPQRLIEIVRGIASDSADQREIWADVPGDLVEYGELGGDEVGPLAAVLAWAAVIETNKFNVRESLLRSLDSLAQSNRVPIEVLELVTSGISKDDLDVAEIDFYASLLHRIEEYRGRSSSGG